MAEESDAKNASAETKALQLAQEAVMVKSVPVAEGTPVVKGFDFNTGRDLDGIMAAAMTTGFQVLNCVCLRGGIRFGCTFDIILSACPQSACPQSTCLL